MRKSINKKAELNKAQLQSVKIFHFDLLKKRLQRCNTASIVIPVENQLDIDLLMPKKQTAQYYLKEFEGYYVLRTTSLNKKDVIYLFNDKTQYFAKELVESWLCSTQIGIAS